MRDVLHVLLEHIGDEFGEMTVAGHVGVDSPRDG
jgi:hypothetical protein